MLVSECITLTAAALGFELLTELAINSTTLDIFTTLLSGDFYAANNFGFGSGPTVFDMSTAEGKLVSRLRNEYVPRSCLPYFAEYNSPCPKLTVPPIGILSVGTLYKMEL